MVSGQKLIAQQKKRKATGTGSGEVARQCPEEVFFPEGDNFLLAGKRDHGRNTARIDRVVDNCPDQNRR